MPQLHYPQELPGTHCIVGWAGRLGRVQRILTETGFDPQTVQPIMSLCTDYRTMIFPVLLCGCETLSLTLRKKPRLRVLKNRDLWHILAEEKYSFQKSS